MLEVFKDSKLITKVVQYFLTDKLAKYRIHEFVEFLEQAPRNPTGKILKTKLKAYCNICCICGCNQFGLPNEITDNSSLTKSVDYIILRGPSQLEVVN